MARLMRCTWRFQIREHPLTRNRPEISVALNATGQQNEVTEDTALPPTETAPKTVGFEICLDVVRWVCPDVRWVIATTFALRSSAMQAYPTGVSSAFSTGTASSCFGGNVN